MMDDVTDGGAETKLLVCHGAPFSLLCDVICYGLLLGGSTGGENAMQFSQLLSFLTAITSRQANDNVSFARSLPPLLFKMKDS